MSRQAQRAVEFYSDGELVKTVTDAETARAIGMYKDVYNKIERFTVVSQNIQAKRPGFIREAIVAQSHRLKIVCIKEYLPGVPEFMDGAYYECGILNKKSRDFQCVQGGVQSLYYKLFRGRLK